jgi:hypothetical protein
MNATFAAAFDSTAAKTIDVQAKIGSAGGTQTMTLRQFSVKKVPVQ